MLKRLICSILLVIAAAAFVPLGTAQAADDGIVKMCDFVGILRVLFVVRVGAHEVRSDA